METTKTRQQSILTFAVKTSPHYTLVSASYGGTTLDGCSLLPSFQTSTEAQTYANGHMQKRAGTINCIYVRARKTSAVQDVVTTFCDKRGSL